jgi:hypothetical protein
MIYLSRVFQVIESAVPEILALSFTDDLSMLVAASSVTQISEQLQHTGEAAIAWEQDNAVQFNREKTEAVLFTRQQGRLLYKQVERAWVQIEDCMVLFNKKATHWLGIWLDTGLLFKAHIQTRMQKARKAEAQIRSLDRMRGLPPKLI